MKKTFKFTCLITIIIFCLLLCSCANKNQGSENFYDFTFKIDNTSITLPSSIKAFTDAGFNFPADFNYFDKNIAPGNLETTYLYEGDNWFNVEIINNTDSALILNDCKIGRFTYDFSGNLEIYTADNFKLNGKKLNDILKKYGEPYSQAEYSTYIEVIYDKDPTSGIYDRYTFRFDNKTNELCQVDIIHFY